MKVVFTGGLKKEEIPAWNVGIVGILFHQDILSSPALLTLFQENTPRAKIIEIPQSSPINHTGKFPVRFIRDYALFPHIPHGLNLPVRKSQREESLIRVEIFGECYAEPVRMSRKFRLATRSFLQSPGSRSALFF